MPRAQQGGRWPLAGSLLPRILRLPLLEGDPAGRANDSQEKTALGGSPQIAELQKLHALDHSSL